MHEDDLRPEPRIGQSVARRQDALDRRLATGGTRRARGRKSGDPRADRARSAEREARTTR